MIVQPISKMLFSCCQIPQTCRLLADHRSDADPCDPHLCGLYHHHHPHHHYHYHYHYQVCIIIYRMAMNIALSTMGNDSQVELLTENGTKHKMALPYRGA